MFQFKNFDGVLYIVSFVAITNNYKKKSQFLRIKIIFMCLFIFRVGLYSQLQAVALSLDGGSVASLLPVFSQT